MQSVFLAQSLLALVSTTLSVQAQLSDFLETAGDLGSNERFEFSQEMPPGSFRLGEPEAGETYWARWTAPEDGFYLIRFSANVASAAVYEGSSVDALSLVERSMPRLPVLRFEAGKDTTYSFCLVRLLQHVPGPIDLSLEPSPPASNDDYDSPSDVGEVADPVFRTSPLTATEDIYDKIFDWENTTWWQWTVPETGYYSIPRWLSFGPDGLTRQEFARRAKAGSEVHEKFTAGDRVRFAAHFQDADLKRLFPFQDTEIFEIAVKRTLLTKLGNETRQTAIDLGQSETAASEGLVDVGGSIFNGIFAGWWTWTSPFDGLVTITAGSDSVSSDLEVFTASGDRLLPLRDWPNEWHLSVSAGAEYLLRVKNSVSDHVRLAIRPTPRPPNDNFEDAALLDDRPFYGNESQTIGATLEVGEPNHFPEEERAGSIWWKWLPREGAEWVVRANSHLLAVYTNDELSELVPLASGMHAVTVNVSPGNVYHIAVLANGKRANTIVCARRTGEELSEEPPPENDTFEEAINLGMVESIQFSGTTVGATIDPFIWYRWTAPKRGVAHVRASGADTASNFRVYLGPPTEGVEPGSEQWTGIFPAEAGEVYFIGAISEGDSVDAVIHYLTDDAPTNDRFEEAKEIETVPYRDATHISFIGGGAEVPAGQSMALWWQWQASSEGIYEINLPATIYAGEDLIEVPLVEIVHRHRRSDQRLVFSAVAGERYHFAFSDPGWSTSLRMRQSHYPLIVFELKASELRLASGDPESPTVLPSEEVVYFPTTAAAGVPEDDLVRLWFEWTAPKEGSLRLGWHLGAYELGADGEFEFKGHPIHVEEGEKVLIALKSHPLGPHAVSFILGEPLSAYETWLRGQFLLRHSPDSGPDADPDGDNLNNLIELVLGSDPMTSSHWQPALVETPGALAYEIAIDKAVNYGNAPLTVQLEISGDLISWRAIPLSAGLNVIALDPEKRSAYSRIRAVRPE